MECEQRPLTVAKISSAGKKTFENNVLLFILYQAIFLRYNFLRAILT